jgi:Phosphoenolpyruvate-dependent sugar phosphotransferase system, EIIA 2
MSVFALSLCSAMNIKDFPFQTDVMIDIAAPNKQKLLFELASKAGSRIRLPPDDVFAELCKREKRGSTGIGAGIALPHARFLSRSGCFFAFGNRLPSTRSTGILSTLCSCCYFPRVPKASS